MTVSPNVGKAQTVLGPVPAGCLGITLPHEHLIVDLSVWFSEPDNDSEKVLAYQPLQMENLYWVHCNSANNLENQRLTDEDAAARELNNFKKLSGNTIVDVTNIGIGRDPLALKRIAQATGLNIITGSGYYVDQSQPKELAEMEEEEIAEKIILELTEGIDGTDVCPGIIGEIGCTQPLADSERKVVRAAVRAQRQTGAPLNIHPGFHHGVWPAEVLTVLQESGADLSRTVFSHVETSFVEVERIGQLAESGCYIEFDTFGRLGRLATLRSFEAPSDGQRVDAIIKLIEMGYLNRILISHDICTKMRLNQYGGHGYGHILYYVVPLMLARGISEEQIRVIMVENPKRLLQFI